MGMPVGKWPEVDCPLYIKEEGLAPQCKEGSFCVEPFVRCGYKIVLELIEKELITLLTKKRNYDIINKNKEKEVKCLE